MKDLYKYTRECLDKYNQVYDTICKAPDETTNEQDEFLQNFCIHLAHALIKDTGYDSRDREELCKIADIINDVCR